MTQTSASLLQRLRENADDAVWERFIRLYSPLLFFWARKAGLQEADAADLVQDVFVILHKEMPNFVYDPTKSFRGWLRTVTLNQWRNRMQKRPPQPLEATADVAHADPVIDFDNAEYRQQLMQRALRIMKSDFEPTTWQACWEVVCHDRPAKDVARELGITVAAVYVAKFRVLNKLRVELQGLWE